MADRDRPARGARPTRVLDAGAGVDDGGLWLQDALRQLRVRAEAAACPSASLLPTCCCGRRRRGVVFSCEHCRSCRPAPLRLGGRALVEHVHARETQSAQACRGTWVRYFFRSGDAWLAGGSRHARDVVRLGADPNRTVIAPLTAVGPNPPLERTGLLVPGQPRYLFVGRFIERKGIDVLLAAFRRLDRGELWLAGDGPLRSFVEEEAKGDPRIRFLGYANEESLPDLYRQADILVVPSLFEPWGLVVHEGLAHGLPVIATDQVAAADDLIESGVNGYVVPAGSHEALAEAMGSVAAWAPFQWREAGAHTGTTLPRYGIDPAADAFVRGCLLGLRHRRALNTPTSR